MDNKIGVEVSPGYFQYVKRNDEGRLSHSIYDTNTLEGVDELEKCRAEFPTLTFKLID